MRRVVLFSTLIVALLGTVPAEAMPWDRTPWNKGDEITIEGHVTDLEGKPLAGVVVLFEAARNSFRLRSFDRETRDRLQMPTRSREDGSFSFVWSWDSYYNTFSLAAALPTRDADGKAGYEIFTRREITTEIDAGVTPVTLPLSVENGQTLVWLQNYGERGGSAEQQRIYDELGRPDRIDTETDDNGVEIVSWWYFPRGAVYRFENGRLDGVTHFDPVP